MKNMVPKYGWSCIYRKNCPAYCIMYASVVALSIVFRNRRIIQEVFTTCLATKKEGLTALGVGVMTYTLYTLLGDVFVEWMYSVKLDPHTMDVSQASYLLLHNFSWIVIVLGIMGGLFVSIWWKRKCGI